MPECMNCGGAVSEAYIRVFAPPELEDEGMVRCCPNCTVVREGPGTRQARSRARGDQRGAVE